MTKTELLELIVDILRHYGYVDARGMGVPPRSSHCSSSIMGLRPSLKSRKTTSWWRYGSRRSGERFTDRDIRGFYRLYEERFVHLH